MKKFIYISAILFGITLMLNGCYTYLSLSNGAELAEIPYEPHFPPDDPFPPPPPPPKPYPPRHGGFIPPNFIPPEDPYKRPKDVAELRDNNGDRNLTEIDRQKR